MPLVLSFLFFKNLFLIIGKIKKNETKNFDYDEVEVEPRIDENEKFIGHNFQGKYLDCGTMRGYINSSLEISKI